MQTNNIKILHGLNIIMVHKTPIVVVGNGLTAEVMCSALNYFGLEYTRLLSQRNDFVDTRTTTINIASQKMLSRLNLWSFSNKNSTEIRNILVSQYKFSENCFNRNSETSGLHFSLDGEIMAWTIENESLFKNCQKHNSKSPSLIENYYGNLNIEYTENGVVINDIRRKKWHTELIIACDGANSAIRESAGLRSTSMAANQEAIVARINLNRLHHNFAVQRFLPDGPLALMPIRTQEAALVWSLSKTKSANIFNLSEGEFKRKIINALGDSFKKMTLCSEKKIWGLKPSVTRSMGRPGLILAGDSNHSIHPLAGMGFNLALADIAVICDCLSSAKKNGLSFSHPSILSEYRARRRLEVEAIIALTQGLNRLFSYNSFKFKTFPSSLTNIGLGIMDSLPIKKQLARIAAGGVLTSASLFSDV